MNAVHFALLAAFSYGTADFLASYYSRRSSPIGIAIVNLLAGGAVLMGASTVVPGEWHTSDVPWVLSAAVCNAVGTVALFLGMTVGTVSVVAPLSGVVASAVACVWGAATGAEVGVRTLTGLGLGALAIPLMSGGFSRSKVLKTNASGLGLLAGLGFGGSWVSISNFDSSSGPLPIGMELALSGGILWLARSRLRATRLRPVYAAAAIGVGLLGAAASASFVAATRQGDVALAAVIAALYPGVSVLWGRYWYGEVLGRRRRWGLVAALTAICVMV